MYFLLVDVSTCVTIWGGGGVVLLYAADYSIFLNTCPIFSCSGKILKTVTFLQDKVSGKISKNKVLSKRTSTHINFRFYELPKQVNRISQ